MTHLTNHEIALFIKCRQVDDPDTGLRHPTNIAINKMSEVKLPRIILDGPRVRRYLGSGEHFDECRR